MQIETIKDYTTKQETSSFVLANKTHNNKKQNEQKIKTLNISARLFVEHISRRGVVVIYHLKNNSS